MGVKKKSLVNGVKMRLLTVFLDWLKINMD